MFQMTPFALQAQLGSAQHGLRCSATHCRRHAAYRRLHLLLEVLDAPGVGPVNFRLEVTPQEEVRWGQVRGAGWPGARLKPRDQTLSEALPQPIPGVLGGVGRSTILLKPLVLESFRVGLQLALEGPPEFRQHLPVSLCVDGLGVAAAVFKEVWSDDAPAVNGAPNCDLCRVETFLCYKIWLLMGLKSKVLAADLAVQVEVRLVGIPNLVDKVRVLLALSDEPGTEAFASGLVSS